MDDFETRRLFRDLEILNHLALLELGLVVEPEVAHPVPRQLYFPVRLASISFAGSPPWPSPVAGQRWCGSWGRQTPG